MPSKKITRSQCSRATVMLVMTVLVAFAVFLVAPEASAQTAFEQFGAATRLGAEPLPVVIARIIRGFIGVLGIVAVIIIIYGGFVYMTAGGDDDKVGKAKRILINGGIGLVIILASYSIATFILNTLLEATGTRGQVTDIADKYGEPLAGSLGVGIVQDHYPPRNALDQPRNVKVFVTFKEPIAPESMALNYDAATRSGTLDPDAVAMSFQGETEEVFLAEGDVEIIFTEDFQTVVFDPVDLLGDGVDSFNYTVFLTPNIALSEGGDAFEGAFAGGYSWTFEVGTELDLTPPFITSVIPISSTNEDFARNTTIQINFNEAMDPIRGTGIYQGGGFNNIVTVDDEDNNDSVDEINETPIDGTYSISNGYRTIEFTTFEVCGEDPCGNLIFCLPGNENLAVLVKAASVNAEDPPQATLDGDGLADAAGNSLDGGIIGGNGSAEGPPADNFEWGFSTSDTIDTTVPGIVHLNPGHDAEFVDPDAPIDITFNIPLKAGTVHGGNAQIWPEFLADYNIWFNPRLEDGNVVRIFHPPFVSEADGGWQYYPLFNNGLRGANQICMHPGSGPSNPVELGETETDIVDGVCAGSPYCCATASGVIPSATSCSTIEGAVPLPYLP